MDQLRQVLSLAPGQTDHGIVFTQCLASDGTWRNLRARSATAEELEKGEVIMDEEENQAPAGESGSHNTHARLAPSGSKQWANCLPSLAFIEANRHRIPEDKGSVYANEGTEAHDWATRVMLKKITIEEVPENFRVHVKSYIDHCFEVIPRPAQVFVEVEVPLFYQTTSKGTCDFAAVAQDGSRVVIRDLKYGAGVLVSSMENSQLAIYGLSLLRWLETEHGKRFAPDTVVDIAVYQPRHHEGADQPAWILTYADLEIFGADLESKAGLAHLGVGKVQEAIEKPRDYTCQEITEITGLEFAPEEGDHGACRWCNAKAICEARLGANTGSLPVTDPAEFISCMPLETEEEAKLPTAERLALRGPLDDEFLVGVLRSAPALKKYLEDVSEYLEKRVLGGENVPGTKLVMGREGNRAWTDEEAVDKWLAGHLKKAERGDFKLKGPAKIEVLIADKLEKSPRTKNKFENLIKRSPARKVLALAEDKRPAAESDVSMMPVEEEEEEFAI